MKFIYYPQEIKNLNRIKQILKNLKKERFAKP